MPSRRTVRKPTVWTPEEWRHIEEAAAACGVRPLRYVRQAALAAVLPPCTRRRGARALRHELTAVLDNLHQLLRLALAVGNPSITAAVESTIRITSEAAQAVATRRGSAEPLIIAVREAGHVLDGLVRQARAAGALPADEELGMALISIQIAALGASPVTLGGLGTTVRSIPSQRTIRKTTVWTPDEWRHIEEAARAHRVPPLRYVREAALGTPPNAKRRARGKDDAYKVAFSHAVQLYLASKQFPLPHLIGTKKDNNSMLQWRNGVYELFEYIPGQGYPQTLESTFDSGRVLSLYHKLLHDFKSQWQPSGGSYHMAPSVEGGLRAIPRSQLRNRPTRAPKLLANCSLRTMKTTRTKMTSSKTMMLLTMTKNKGSGSPES